MCTSELAGSSRRRAVSPERGRVPSRPDLTGRAYAQSVLTREESLALAELEAVDLLGPAQALRAERESSLITYSPKVFIPLTKLCRDVCHYCTFAAPPRRGERAYMSADEVPAAQRAGAEAG